VLDLLDEHVNSSVGLVIDLLLMQKSQKILKTQSVTCVGGDLNFSKNQHETRDDADVPGRWKLEIKVIA
jgi:hypothetical protein